MTAEEIRAARRKVPPKEVRILVPVWGDHFVAQFLYYLLPTLLAPGNIPGVVLEVPVRFIVLCSASDLIQIRGHPTWKLLTTRCSVEIKPIDDIVTSSNSPSTTVTLAFEREVRAVGEAMVDTCFVFLTPDYVMADGSLVALWRRMKDGASGIQAGNFQISGDALKFDMIPRAKLTWARPRREKRPTTVEAIVDAPAGQAGAQEFSPATFEEENLMPAASDPTAGRHGRGLVSIAQIPARQLTAFALANLHPVTIGNTVNFLASHNVHTNRLFWWVDDKTLIGRFFLMHMICIRPEVVNFQIGSSCDYSFIPEMCPSGNVDIITDSDEYLVVEAQPNTHEQKYTRFGPLQPGRLARSLTGWTTALHRANARHTVVFHAGPIPERVENARTEADRFIAEVNSALANSPPLPHRGHPYWRQAAAFNHFFSGKEFSQEDYEALQTSVTGRKTRLGSFGKRFGRFVMGKRPILHVWQPRWSDYRALKERLAAVTQENSKKTVLLVTADPVPYLDWAHNIKKNLIVSLPWPFSVKAGRAKPVWPTKFDVVIADLNEDDINNKVSVNRIAAVAAPGAELLVLIRNQRRHALIGFNRVITANLDLLQATSAHHVYASFVRMSRLRWSMDWALERLARSCERHQKSSPLVAVLCLLMMPVLTLVNLFEVSTAGLRWPRQRWSSVFLAFRAQDQEEGTSG